MFSRPATLFALYFTSCAVFEFSGAVSVPAVDECFDNGDGELDFGCAVRAVKGFQADGGTFCENDDFLCHKNELVAQIHAMQKPYAQYVPIVRQKVDNGTKIVSFKKWEEADQEVATRANTKSSPMRLLGNSHFREEDYRKRREGVPAEGEQTPAPGGGGEQPAVGGEQTPMNETPMNETPMNPQFPTPAPTTRAPTTPAPSGSPSSSPTTTHEADGIWCDQRNADLLEADPNATLVDRFECELYMLQHRILYCSSYLYLVDDAEDYHLENKEDSSGSGSGSLGYVIEPYSNLYVYFPDGSLDLVKTQELMEYMRETTGQNEWERNALLNQGDHIIGVSEGCFADLVDLVTTQKMGINKAELPSPSFVCQLPQLFKPMAPTQYGQMECEQAIFSLMGLNPFEISNTSGLTADQCNHPLSTPVGEFFKDVIKVGSLVLSAGRQCCEKYQDAPGGSHTCDEWGKDPKNFKSSSDNSTDVVGSNGSFQWSDYWSMYDHGEAYLVPIIVFIVMMVVFGFIQYYQNSLKTVSYNTTVTVSSASVPTTSMADMVLDEVMHGEVDDEFHELEASTKTKLAQQSSFRRQSVC